MEIIFAEVRFRNPHRKGVKIIFAAQGSGAEALAKINGHAKKLRTDPRMIVRVLPHQPSEAEEEQARLIVPRIPTNSAIEIIA